MSNIKLAKPSIVFGYWRPWNEDSHLIDSYLDYARDVTLTKYGADIVGKYVSMASREQVLAINSLGQKIGLGMNVLSNQMAGISNQMVGISDQMTVVIDELNFLNKNIDIMVEQQHLTNLLLEDISKLLRIPDREKERQQNILHGIKFFVNAEKDPDLFDDALEELLCAEQLMKQDYFVLHRIGLIYLHAHKHINPKKALDYFTRAAKYASVESDPDAVRLVNSLTNHDKSDIKYLAAESYENAAFAAYILGDFELAVANQSKALNFQTTPQNRFLYAKYLARNKQIKECIENLDIAIKKLPALALAVFKEIDLTNEPEVLDLVEQFLRRQEE
jgi:tetratricopeptide (TPR) repeat protein